MMTTAPEPTTRTDETGRQPRWPHATIPASLQVGNRLYPLGDVPAWDELPPIIVDMLLEHTAAEARQAVKSTCSRLSSYLEAFRMLDYWQEFQDAFRATPPGVCNAGPIIRVLRRHAGLSRAALAAAIGRDRGTLAAWESGRPTKCHIGDIERAARTLGYSSSAILIVLDWLAERTPLAAVPA